MPAVAMGATFVGFGAVVNEVGFGIGQALASTAAMTLIPAQIVMVELFHAGAGLATIVLAVLFVGARLLPMTVAVMPILRHGRRDRLEFYAGAFILATMSWTYSMQRGPTLPTSQRMAYFWGVAVLNYAVVITGTGIGYALAGGLPVEIMRGLVFLMPVFFLLVFTAEAASRAVVLALVLGGVLGPAIFVVSPEWSVLGCGLAGGTLAFLVRRRLGGGDD